MSHIHIHAKLPGDALAKLRSCAGVNIREESEFKVVELVESFEGQQLFFQFLKDGDEIDPLLLPQFGPLAYPYVPLAVQLEVYDILHSFQSLMAADFRPGAGAIPLIPAPALVVGGFQFHHAKIACHAVHEEIQQPYRIAAAFPGLNSIVSGHVICDLSLFFANCVVVTRIRKY
mmetsp:Transcript_19866/g.28559  ORF Transcript_19866/g.28559 Transcript_19866/m.28559 type:complete len:174 (+) Transcript_19866:20-541(+)|eukprot:CAMPEP_0185034634 /NCGR_PEP_ID=MMETSP1103-20130426/24695_1 /TAXON_ID=36769 /ORGANISM="Paraphysomonas bandaiensis, Strain Caron Lab Isolate" /LENGTH=173 /DNA_ID=CAMNT_0027571371 /DNA_START=13 /DNA_END=534 /DNA_ORIENTATION=+